MIDKVFIALLDGEKEPRPYGSIMAASLDLEISYDRLINKLGKKECGVFEDSGVRIDRVNIIRCSRAKNKVQFHCNGVMNTGLNTCKKCGAKSGNACEQ